LGVLLENLEVNGLALRGEIDVGLTVLSIIPRITVIRGKLNFKVGFRVKVRKLKA